MIKHLFLAILCIVVMMTAAQADPTNIAVTYNNVTLSNISIVISWDQTNIDNFSNYTLTRIQGGLPTVIFNTSNIAVEDYLDSGLTPGTTYTYELTASNISNDIAIDNYTSNPISVEITIFQGIYQTASSLTAEATNSGEITLNWTVFNETNIESLFLERFNDTDLESSQDITSSINTGFFIDTITEEITYKYRINITYDNEESYAYPLADSQRIEVEGNFDPVIDSNSVVYDRSGFFENVQVTVVANDSSSSVLGNLSYSYNGTPGTISNIACINNFGTHSCNFVIISLPLVSGENISFTATIFENSIFASTTTFNSTVVNALPEIQGNIDIVPTTVETTDDTLVCSFTADDSDGDSVNAAYIWYIQNEGEGLFNEVLGETNQTISSPIFDLNDRVICSVQLTDGIGSTPYENSSIETIVTNVPPRVYETFTNVTIVDPGQVGNSVLFYASVVDTDLGFNENITVNFCLDTFNPINTIENTNTLQFGNETNESQLLWFFPENLNIALEYIELTVTNITDSSASTALISEPIYDFYIYEVNSYGQIPDVSDEPITKDEDNIFVSGETQKFFFDNARVSNDSFMAIKLCINSNNDENATCDTTYENKFMIGYNENYNETFGELKFLARNSSFTYDQTNSINFSSGTVSFSYGLNQDGSDCGSNTVCGASSSFGERDVTIWCEYTVTGNESEIQRYSVFATDSNGGISKSVNGTFYVNHIPTLDNTTTIYKLNNSEAFTYEPALGSALVNESLQCVFTVSDEDANWRATGANYSVSWEFKRGGSNWQTPTNQIIFGDPTEINLSSGNTQAGDEWRCLATPNDSFVQGETEYSESVAIIQNTNISIIRPTVTSVYNNDSNEADESVYVGGDIDVTVSWNDANFNQFIIYVCGDAAENATFGQNGCLRNELYRSQSLISGNLGQNVQEISFEVTDDASTGENFYTVVICNENTCSEANTNTQGSYYAAKLRNIQYVEIRNSTGGIVSDTGLADVSNNLQCFFNYTDGDSNLEYTQDNLSELVTNGILVQRWLKNTSFDEYETIYTNTPEIANTLTNENEKWICQIEFLEVPITQQTNSSAVSIQNLTTAMSNPPELTSFFASKTLVNAGEEYIYTGLWQDIDSQSVNIYLCNSSSIIPTGCQDSTFSFQTGVLASPIQIPYITENQNSENLTIFAGICDLTSCSEIRNVTVSVNNRPSSQDVSVIKITSGQESSAECSYSYKSNSVTNDEDITATRYLWTYIDSLGNISQIKNETGTSGKFVNTTDLEGQIYCGVRTQDIQGVQDTQFINSQVTALSDTTYVITALPLTSPTNQSILQIQGIVENANTTVTSYTYQNDEEYILLTNSTNSFEFQNPVINSSLSARLSEKNTTFIFVSKDAQGINEEKFSMSTSKFIGFSNHNKSNFTYYNYSLITNNPSFLILNLTSPLEANVSDGEIITIHRYENKTGYFNLLIDLYLNADNYISLFSVDGGEFTFSSPVYVDTTTPVINITTLSTNQSHLMRNGELEIIIEDLELLDTEFINVSIEKDGVIEYSLSPDNFSADFSILPIILTLTNTSDTTIEIVLILGEIVDVGMYQINVTGRDIVGNTQTLSKNFEFDDQAVSLSNIRIIDDLTGNEEGIYGENITLMWNISPDNEFATDIVIYKTTNETNIEQIIISSNDTQEEITLELEEGSCYEFSLQTISTFGIFSQIVSTACQPVIFDPIILENVTIFDYITQNTSQLKSNEILVQWNVSNEALLESANSSLYNNVTGLIEPKNILNISSKILRYTIDDLENNSCYFVSIEANTNLGVKTTAQTKCITYIQEDNLIFELDSENEINNTLIFNEIINFSITTYNAYNFTYTIRDKELANNFPVPETTVATDFITDINTINFTRVLFPLDKTFYDLELFAYGDNGLNDTISKTIIFDNKTPVLGNFSNITTFNNTENISFFIDVDEEYILYKKTLIHNSSGINQTIDLVSIGDSPIQGFERFEGNITEFIPSSTLFTIYFNITDYARNTNLSEPIDVTIENRAPIQTLALDTIYWNKSIFIATYDLSQHFTDLDSDILSYTIVDKNTIDGDVSVNNESGLLFGNLLSNSNFENNFTLNVTDKNGATLQKNLTLYAVNESCTQYSAQNSVFLGFTQNCGQTTAPPTSGGGSGGNSGNGGSSSGGGGGGSRSLNVPFNAERPITSSQYHKETFIPIIANTKEIVNINNNLSIKEISFQYGKDISYATLEVKKIQNLPSYITIFTPIYEIIEISSPQLQNEFLNEVILEFEVEKNNAIGINKNNAIVYRWNQGDLEKYDLTFFSEDLNSYYYRVSVPGFSYWIISVNENYQAPEEPIADTEFPEEDFLDQTPSEEFPREPELESPIETTTNSVLQYILWAVIGVLVLGVCATGYVYAKQRGVFGEAIEKSIPVVTPEEIKTNPLPEYIKKHLKKGIVKEKIIAVLIDAGWNEEAVEKAMDDVEKELREEKKDVDHSIVEQILYMKDKDLSDEEIIEELQEREIPEQIIEQCLEYTETVEKLEEDIKVWAKKGYTRSQIKAYLLELSWPAQTVYMILKRFK